MGRRRSFYARHEERQRRAVLRRLRRDVPELREQHSVGLLERAAAVTAVALPQLLAQTVLIARV